MDCLKSFAFKFVLCRYSKGRLAASRAYAYIGIRDDKPVVQRQGGFHSFTSHLNLSRSCQALPLVHSSPQPQVIQ
jgi:hypothetical protein